MDPGFYLNSVSRKVIVVWPIVEERREKHYQIIGTNNVVIVVQMAKIHSSIFAIFLGIFRRGKDKLSLAVSKCWTVFSTLTCYFSYNKNRKILIILCFVHKLSNFSVCADLVVYVGNYVCTYVESWALKIILMKLKHKKAFYKEKSILVFLTSPK